MTITTGSGVHVRVLLLVNGRPTSFDTRHLPFFPSTRRAPLPLPEFSRGRVVLHGRPLVVVVPRVDERERLPDVVTGWLSPWHCGLHGARVQKRIHKAGAARWRTRTVEVRRRQPGGRATRRRPLPALMKQVRKAMRRMAREAGR